MDHLQIKVLYSGPCDATNMLNSVIFSTQIVKSECLEHTKHIYDGQRNVMHAFSFVLLTDIAENRTVMP